MKRDSKESLIQELKDNNGLLGVKAFSEYMGNGVIVKIRKANTEFSYDKELILSDGTSVVAWI